MSLNSQIISSIPSLLALVVPFPIFTILGSFFESRLNSKALSNWSTTSFPLYMSCLYNILSKGTHPFGRVSLGNFITSKFIESGKTIIWDSEKSLLLYRNLSIWAASSKTFQCSRLSGIDVLKTTSIFHNF
jgi:hypothetical protein